MYQDIGCIGWRDSLLFVKAQSLHGNGWFWSQRRLLSSCPRPLYHFLSIEEGTSGTTQQESVWLYLWHSQQPIFLVCISIWLLWLQWFAWQDMPWLSKASRNQCFFRHCFFFRRFLWDLTFGFAGAGRCFTTGNSWSNRCWTWRCAMCRSEVIATGDDLLACWPEKNCVFHLRHIRALGITKRWIWLYNVIVHQIFQSHQMTSLTKIIEPPPAKPQSTEILLDGMEQGLWTLHSEGHMWCIINLHVVRALQVLYDVSFAIWCKGLNSIEFALFHNGCFLVLCDWHRFTSMDLIRFNRMTIQVPHWLDGESLPLSSIS